MRNNVRTLLVWLVLVGVIFASAQALLGEKDNKQQINYSQFIEQVNKGEVTKVTIEGSVVSGYVIKGERTDQTQFFTNAPLDDKLIETLLGKQVDVKVIPEEKPSMFGSLLFSLLPVLLLIAAWFYFMRMQAGGGG